MSLGLAVCSACGVRADSLGGSSLSTTDDTAKIKVQVQALLREVFPNLTSDEVDQLSVNLTLESALALQAEIMDMRALASSLSKDLSDAASAAAKQRSTDLASRNDGFPMGLEPLGSGAFYDAAHAEARVDLSGVFSDHTAVALADGELSVSIGGSAQTVQMSCASNDPVDIVFLVDVTGSMSPVIGAVQRSLQKFVTAIVDKGVSGTLGVVTFQDDVGVNISFQEPKGSNGYERSPFFKPVDIGDATGIAQLQRFITRLEADSGADIPENLAGAIDFAQNDVIGLTKSGAPNVIGDGVEDPQGTSAWPKLSHARHIFVAFTDAPFHSDSRTPSNSSLLAPFKPRPIATILKTLQSGSTTVHVSDPSWVDETTTPTGSADEVSVDSDYWAINTGGLGEDRVAGYSPIDLDLLVTAADTGLLDILLDGVVATTCSARFPAPSLALDATLDLAVSHAGQSYTSSLTPVRF
ncbi:MAG TPA: vWA domain-containing protein [Polyangiaceae bacterium]|nr:vWA domain-containing protein [Polyangiaceae bacterium]